MMSPDSHASRRPALPFALKELEILGGCAPSMWALIRPSDNGAPGDGTARLDLDLCDDRGQICVRMKGLTSRVLEGETDPAEPAAPTAALLSDTQPITESLAMTSNATPAAQSATLTGTAILPTPQGILISSANPSPSRSASTYGLLGVNGSYPSARWFSS